MARQDAPRAAHVPLVKMATRTACGHKQAVTAVSWSCDGSLLLAGGDSASVRAFDCDRLAQRDLTSDRDSAVYTGHADAVDSVVAAPQDRGLFATVSGRDATVRLYSARAQSRAPVWTLPLGAAALRSAAWSPDGKWIVVGDAADKVHIVNAEKGAVSRTVSGKQARDWAWSPDGRLVFVARDDGRVEVVSWPCMEHFTYLLGHRGRVVCIAVDPTARRLAVSSDDTLVSVWSARTLNCEAMIDRGVSAARRMDYSFDGKYLATDGSAAATPGIEISDAETGTRVTFIPTSGAVRDLKWHPRRLLLAYCVVGDHTRAASRPPPPARSSLYPTAPATLPQAKAYVYGFMQPPSRHR